LQLVQDFLSIVGYFLSVKKQTDKIIGGGLLKLLFEQGLRLASGIYCDCLRGNDIKGSRKNNFVFQAPVHPAQLRCESLEYLDNPALSRLAGQAPRHLKM
jgi:hypothetical protein